MHRTIILSCLGFVYYALVFALLNVTDAGIVATAIGLFVVPAAFLAHYSYAPSAVILCVVIFGLGLGVMLEGSAHIYGLWYTLGVDESRLFGLVPVEALILIASQVLFLALLYEMMFDDGNYTALSAYERSGAFVVFAFGTGILLALHNYVLKGFFVEYAYLWLLFVFASSALAALALYRAFTPVFVDRLFYFTLVGAIPSLCAVLLSVTNVHKVFANPAQYLSVVSVHNVSLPLEELLLAFLLPFLVATIYELYLDDQE